MKKVFFTTLVLIAVLLVVAAFWELSRSLHPATTQNAQTSYTNPYSYTNTNTTSVTNPVATSSQSASSQSTAQMTIPLVDGKTLTVNDFLHNHETVPDTVNPGYYYLAGSIGYCLADGSCPSGYKTDDFTVTYNNVNGHFNIVLLTEPLVKARAEAEIFLLNRLGVSEGLLCNINYWIGTTEEVNVAYANKNLGFDFCPGATVLPQ